MEDVKIFYGKFSEDVLELIGRNRKDFVTYENMRAPDGYLDVEKARKHFEKRNPVIIKAMIGNKLVGFVSIHEIDEGLKLSWLLVDREFRNKGVGSRLLEEVIRYAKSKGYNKIFLNTWHTNEKAIKLYERYGFRVYNVKENDRGPGVHTVQMVLHLR
jgi:ribosomal protein S18 acetylase RimI-like enzyme